MSKSFAKMASQAASTKRNPLTTSGKRGAPTTNLASIKILPLMPLDPEIAERLNIQLPTEALQTFVDGTLDILEGDFLTVSAKDYRIRSVGDWPWTTDGFKALILEEDKGA